MLLSSIMIIVPKISKKITYNILFSYMTSYEELQFASSGIYLGLVDTY